MAPSSPSKAALQLKRLREDAGISMPDAAAAAGYKGRVSSYQHWEDRTKKEVLPLEMIRGLARLFEARGLDNSQLWALAGILPSSSGGDLSPQSTESVNDFDGSMTAKSEAEVAMQQKLTELIEAFNVLDPDEQTAAVQEIQVRAYKKLKSRTVFRRGQTG